MLGDARRPPPALRADVLAGVTVAAYLVPQVMAYAELAGVAAVTGLWAALAALAVYAVLGSSPQLSVGPESSTALMTAAALGSLAGTGASRADLAAALAIAVGVLCLVGWLGGLAFVADLLSRPVLVGYMAGIAAVMVLSQAGRLTGASIPREDLLERFAWLWQHPAAVHGPTLAVGTVTLAALCLGAWLTPRAPVVLVGMLAATVAVALLDLEGKGVALVGTIPAGVPVPAVPQVSWGDTLGLMLPALALATVGFTDNILTARSFASRHGDRIDARRELLALGAANVGAGLLHGFPVSSSGSRTAIVDAAGGRSRRVGVATLLAILLALLTLRPVLAAFPATALAAVVIYAGFRLVDLREFRRFLRFRTSEFVIAAVTCLSVVGIGVMEGVLVAVGLSLVDLLRRVARPHDAVEGYVPGLAGMHDIDDYETASQVPGLVVYRYDSPLFFANSADFLTRARKAVADAVPPARWLVLNTEAMVEVDITAADALESLRRELADDGVVLALARVKQDLRNDLEPTGLLARIGTERVFPTLPTAVAAYQEWAAGAQSPPEHGS